MSQYGAYSAARQGATYREILRTYYPRTRWKQLGGSIEVLVSGDDDRDLVVADTRRADGPQRPVGPHVAAERAARHPVADHAGTRGARSIVSFHDGRWRTWKTVRGDVELAAGSGGVALITPDGRVPYRGALRSSAGRPPGAGERQRAPAGAVPPRGGSRGDAGGLAAARAARTGRRGADVRRVAPRPPARRGLRHLRHRDLSGLRRGRRRGGVERHRRPRGRTSRCSPTAAGPSSPSTPPATAGTRSAAASPTCRRCPTRTRAPRRTTTAGRWRSRPRSSSGSTTSRTSPGSRSPNATATGRVARLELTTEGGDAPDTYPVDVARFVSSFGLRSSLFRVTEVD